MKKILLNLSIAAFLMTGAEVQAQSALDVLRLSNQTLLGTGRSAGTNTNLGGIGADFTSLSFNPAGIAQYRKSEIMFSPTVTNTSTESILLNGSQGDAIKDNKTKFRLPNLGLIIANSKNSKVSYAFGVGVNGFVDNNQNFQFSGKSAGSISERFSALANGSSPEQLDNFEAGLAWDTELLIDQRDDGSYSYDYENFQNVELNKYQNVRATGRYNEVAFSGGVNLGNKFLLGATIGIPVYRYNETKVYQERDLSDAVEYFEEIQFREYKSLSGVGVNAKLGAMYKPVNNIIIGASIHSPSFISISYNFSTELDYSFTFENELNSNTSESPEGTIDYTVTTPMKAQGSIGAILGRFGFVNAEVEYQDYGTSKIKIDSDNLFDKQVEDQINSDIKANYKSALKINFGAEIAAIENFRIRAGIGVAQSPYAGENEFLPNFGLGFGYRTDFLFLDLGYRQWKSENGYEPYFITQANRTLVNQKLTQSAFVLTIGFKLM